MVKCKHPRVEEHKYEFMSGKGVRCADCHAVMMANSKGHAFLEMKRVRIKYPIPLERKYWKEYVNRQPDPMSYEARMRGYDNIHVVRR